MNASDQKSAQVFAYSNSPLRENELVYTTMVSFTISAIHLRCTSVLCMHFTAILRLSWLLCSSQGYCGMSIWRNMDWCLVHHHDICSPYSSCHTLICHSTALHHLVCQRYVYSSYKVAAVKTWLIAASFPTLVTLQLNPVISQYYFLLPGRGIWIGRHVQISSLYYVTV